ncbi:BCD family MFS transporter [Phaeovibrio sulfidiphilus]|uniref:BCD family MFS transporter n=1 Tax=Phaeovibrio sulfidiphilus TaxID=1220600 RepID=A0A8J6YHC7_9PROT|nr:BCD family MFS transporter [Phaeovibrio sulfidiphilus]MBE1236321.1 BCD family MFS transporter [Phaeovibrio sulfidiphilus]
MSGAPAAPAGLSWFGIIRLGVVMFCVGSVIILTTSVFNRIINYEYGLPAMIPGILVGWREALQFMRPRWGYGSDRGGRRTPWIVWGMGMLAIGGALGALSTVLMDTTDGALFQGFYAGPIPGFAVAVVAYTFIGIGVGAAGTCLLALLATTVAPGRRPASAALVWILMIVGFAVTAGVASKFLGTIEPARVAAEAADVALEALPELPGDTHEVVKSRFSPVRLLVVCLSICLASFLVSCLALWGLERKNPPIPVAGAADAASRTAAESQSFWAALQTVMAEPRTMRFGLFVFVAMLGFELQALIMEPFAAHAFRMDLAQTTRLASYQHGGVALGMVLVGALGSILRGTLLGSFRFWAVTGCLMSAFAHVLMVMSGAFAPDWPLPPTMFFLGFSNGVFAVAAIGSMMLFASEGGHGSEGTRMGIWGIAQAVALGAGAVLGTVIADAGYYLFGQRVPAFQAVFALEALLFAVSVLLVLRIGPFGSPPRPGTVVPVQGAEGCRIPSSPAAP